MARVLMPLPKADFDPTESGVPWRMLRERGHRVVFATPDGQPAQADPKTVTGKGLGLFAPFLKADANGRAAYDEMSRSAEFRQPLRYDAIRAEDFDGLILPGGHAPGMRDYLESPLLQAAVVDFFRAGKPVGAICHGVLLVARSHEANGKSVLYGRKTTALTKMMELSGWALTRLYLGSYFRTYSTTVEDEVKAALANPRDFLSGPFAMKRDSPVQQQAGFTVRAGNYLSARWPGDAHRFAAEFSEMLKVDSRNKS